LVSGLSTGNGPHLVGCGPFVRQSFRSLHFKAKPFDKQARFASSTFDWSGRWEPIPPNFCLRQNGRTMNLDRVLQLHYDHEGHLIPGKTKRISENLVPADSK
jgi:hypothetical protein